jgi:hypothetical protein
MQIPDEFYEFCLYLHQDSFDFYGREPQDLATGALRFVPKEKHAALRAFLDHLLTGNYSDAQLQEIYRSTDADIGFRSGLRYFLALVRDTIDGPTRRVD